MLQLIEYFQSNGSKIVFGTTAQKNENSLNLELLGIETHQLRLNDSSFDELLKEIDPSIVVFDRFLIEEQFGWRVAENLPNTLRILDTEDLHCLRKVREKRYSANAEFQLSDLLPEEITKREIASILRCDLSLMISKFEMEVLTDFFKISKEILWYLPFLLGKSVDAIDVPEFEERVDFISIGNFLHPPNLDSVVTLKNEVWSKIKERLPEAKLHIYGAYPNQQVLNFHAPKDGFLVHGFVENQHKVLRKARVLLAPLSFGAGLKGKFLDSMLNGCPSVTTSIGIEGYSSPENWSGAISDNRSEFAEKSVALYLSETKWQKAKTNGFQILQQFDKNLFESEFSCKLDALISDLNQHRNRNFMGSLLLHHRVKSTKYLSKWIEAKNRF